MLQAQVDAAKRTVNTDTVQISVGEIATMYSNDELNISPEFQRLFRWSIEKKSAFIESILVGIPVPSVFVFENDDATWELIDGLQRISTILEFMGNLKVNSPDGDAIVSPSQLVSTKYLPALENAVFGSDAGDQQGVPLDKSTQLFLRRARIDFQILKHPSDPKTKFDLFQRLNRGGAYANPQEVRTCAMVLAHADATQSIRAFAQKDEFQRVLRITEEQAKSQLDVEYAVRAVVHLCREFTPRSDVQEFLDREIVDILVSNETEQALEDIRWAIELLDAIGQGNVLVPHDQAADGIAPRFSLPALEAILVGVAKNRQSIAAKASPEEYVKARIDQFWREKEVAEMSGSGLRGTTRIQRTIPFGSLWFASHEEAR